MHKATRVDLPHRAGEKWQHPNLHKHLWYTYKLEYMHRRQQPEIPQTQTRIYMKCVRMVVYRGKGNGSCDKRSADQGFSTKTGVQ